MNLLMNQNEKYILCIYKEKNLSKAAKALGISQPAVSLCLNNMEKQLGFKIFDRNRSPISPTKQGKLYLQYIAEKEALSHEYERKILDIDKKNNYSITVGGSSIYVQYLLLNPIIAFEEENKDCKITIKEAPLSELVELTENGEMDFFISTSKELSGNITMNHLITEHLYLCIPADWDINDKIKTFAVNIGERGQEFDYKLLNGKKFIFLEKNQPLQKEMDAFFEEFNIMPDNNIIVNQSSLAVKLACLGKGIALVTEEALWGLEHKNKLLFYSLPERYEKRELYIAYNSERYLAIACQRLIELLQKDLEEKKR